MNKVWKFEIVTGLPVTVPAGTKLLRIARQDSMYGNGIMVWGLVPENTDSSIEVEVIIAGTGHEFDLPEGFNYLNSFEHVGGTQYHAFIRYPS